MKLGIMSDTHGNTNRTERALEVLLAHNIAAICHCGDVGSESVLIALAAACLPRAIPVHVALGNVDHWDCGVRDFPRGTGVTVHGRRAELEIGGRRIVVIHGDDPAALDEAIHSQRYNYCLTGHTHCAEHFTEGPTRVINPGALQRTKTPSVAVLDLETDELQILHV